MKTKNPQKAAVKMPTKAEDREINREAKTDPDAQPLTLRQLEAMVPMDIMRRSRKA